MSTLYGRQFKLLLSAGDGHALDMSEFHVTFTVRQWESATPNTADCRIYNLKTETAQRIGTKEFDRLILQAGYRDQFGTIFDGTVIQTRRGRTSPVDTYVDVTAFDGDRGHNLAVVNTTLAAGARPADVHKALCNAMNPYGVTQGYTDTLPGPALPRGRVLYGMARDHMRDLTDATDTVWNIQNGQVQTVARTGYQPGEAVVLTSATGMVGLPQQTQDGIVVRSLLNPLLKVNNRVKIDEASIQQARLDPTFAGANPVQAALLPKIDSDGIYRLLAIDHGGDTRGNDWYSDITCISLDGTIPQGQVNRGRV